MASVIENAFIPFPNLQAPPTRRAPPLHNGQWTNYRQIIEELYIKQERKLDEVVDFMKQTYGFHATYDSIDVDWQYTN